MMDVFTQKDASRQCHRSQGNCPDNECRQGQKNCFWLLIFWPRSFLSCASAGHQRRSTTKCCMSAHRHIKGTTVAAQQRQRPIPSQPDSRWATRTPRLALQTLPDMWKVQNLLPALGFARNNVPNIYKIAFYSGRDSPRKMGFTVFY